MSPDDTDTDTENLPSLDDAAVSAPENGANGSDDETWADAEPPADDPAADAGGDVDASAEAEAAADDAGVAESETEASDEGESETEATASDEGESETEATAADDGETEAEVGATEASATEAEASADDGESESEAAAGDDGESETVAEAGATEAEASAGDGETETAAGDGEDVEVLTDEQLLVEPAAIVDNPYTRPGRWFVVHTQSGYEKKVKQNLEARIHSMNAEEAVYEVVIPMEDYVDFKNGKRVVAQRKMFPGYLLVRAELDDTAWFVIRNTPGVTGFVGQGAKPSPLPRKDVEAFLMPKGTEEQVATRAKPRLEYEIGETVRVREGPFADFSGEVIEINEDQLKLKVLVNIFGRETPVELEFSKVAKL
jgi:transcription termination/antitermination protein NusG